jgi:hypothetical protein
MVAKIKMACCLTLMEGNASHDEQQELLLLIKATESFQK